MPQFDFFSFSAQVFTFLTIFVIMYFTYLRFFLVPISEVLKIRSKIQSITSNTTNFVKTLL